MPRARFEIKDPNDGLICVCESDEQFARFLRLVFPAVDEALRVYSIDEDGTPERLWPREEGPGG